MLILFKKTLCSRPLPRGRCRNTRTPTRRCLCSSRHTRRTRRCRPSSPRCRSLTSSHSATTNRSTRGRRTQRWLQRVTGQSGRWSRRFGSVGCGIERCSSTAAVGANWAHLRNLCFLQIPRCWRADNGGPSYLNGTSGANNFPLRGGKMSNAEGYLKRRFSPFVFGWCSSSTLFCC